MEKLTYDHDEIGLDGILTRVYTYTCKKIINGGLYACKYELHVHGTFQSRYMVSAKPIKA